MHLPTRYTPALEALVRMMPEPTDVLISGRMKATGSLHCSKATATGSRHQQGAYFVEAALVTPLLLLITFAAIFFCILAAKNFALQTFATDVARDVSLSLQAKGSAWCPSCGTAQVASTNQVVLSTFSGSYDSCWKTCANSRYPIIGANNVTITVSGFPVTNFFDGDVTYTGLVAPGDLFNVSVQYSSSNFMGGNVPFLGSFNFNLQGTAVGVIERP